MSGNWRSSATRFTSPDHPAFQPMMRMFDALIRSDTSEGRVMVTKHGLVTETMAREYETKIEHDDGKTLIVFPVRYRWKRKPNSEDASDVGERGDPVYRSAAERKPAYSTFSIGTHQPPQQREKEWWEE
jgi:hypothetical protein